MKEEIPHQICFNNISFLKCMDMSDQKSEMFVNYDQYWNKTESGQFQGYI